MTPTDVEVAFSLIDRITVPENPLIDLLQNDSAFIFSLEPRLIPDTSRMYMWTWLMLGYELGQTSTEMYVHQVASADILSAFRKIGGRIEEYDESLLSPIQYQINAIELKYANDPKGICKVMLAMVCYWLCEMGMLIARQPSIVKFNLQYCEEERYGT